MIVMFLLNILLLNIFLSFYLLYLALLVVAVLKAISKFKGFSKTCIWVSDLGKVGKGSAKYFNKAINLYGLLSLSLAIKAYYVFPQTMEAQIIIAALMFISTATFLLGFFPKNSKAILHFTTGAVAFTGVLVIAFFGMQLDSKIHFFPEYFGIMHFILLYFTPIALIGGVLDYAKVYPKKLNLFIRITGIIEWLVFVITILWNFSMAIFLILQ
jgi:hypothetical protein